MSGQSEERKKGNIFCKSAHHTVSPRHSARRRRACPNDTHGRGSAEKDFSPRLCLPFRSPYFCRLGVSFTMAVQRNEPKDAFEICAVLPSTSTHNHAQSSISNLAPRGERHAQGGEEGNDARRSQRTRKVESCSCARREPGQPRHISSPSSAALRCRPCGGANSSEDASLPTNCCWRGTATKRILTPPIESVGRN